MTFELKRVSVWSVAKIAFIFGAVFGFLAGLFLWMFAGLLANLPLDGYGSALGMDDLGAMGIVLPFFMAMFYGVISMIGHAVIVAIYNVLASLLGGVELTLQERAQPVWAAPAGYAATPPPPPAPPAPPAAPTQPPPPPASGG